eukprot:12400047-Karenia_brevis.AAC.1
MSDILPTLPLHCVRPGSQIWLAAHTGSHSCGTSCRNKPASSTYFALATRTDRSLTCLSCSAPSLYP